MRVAEVVVRILESEGIEPAFDRAINCGRPAVIDIIVARETDASMGASLDAIREFS